MFFQNTGVLYLILFVILLPPEGFPSRGYGTFLEERTVGLLQRFLTKGGLLVGDGAMGTMLQASGLEPGEAPEGLNLIRPRAVREVHQAYADAWADVLTTNTFGANRFRLSLHDLEEGVPEVNRAAAGIAREAALGAGREILVAGGMGPTGALLEPIGDLPFEQAREAFAEQCRALAEGGVDFLLIETMSDLEEVRAAVEACHRNCDLPVLCTMTFDMHGRTMMGTAPEEARKTAERLGVDAFGANCGNGPFEIEAIMQEMADSSRIPLIVQPNAGRPRLADGQINYGVTPERMAEHALRCFETGVRYIGGCCGTTPEHVRAAGEALRRAWDRRPTRLAPSEGIN